METWKERVQDEHAELTKNIDKLDSYLELNDSKLDEEDIMLLTAQSYAMKGYASLLEMRMSKHSILVKK